MSSSFTQVRDILADNADVTAVTTDPNDVGPVMVGASDADLISRMEHEMAAGYVGMSVDMGSVDLNGGLGANIIRATVEEAQRSDTMISAVIDPNILAMMRAAETIMITEGDIWEMMLVPMQLGFQGIEFTSGNKRDNTIARDYLDSIRIQKRLEEQWLSYMTYGQTYPVFGREGKDITDVLVANPKQVAVKRQYGFGARSYALAPAPQAVQELLDASPSFVYRPIGAAWNEVEQRGMPAAVEVNKDDIMHIGQPKFGHSVYSVPPVIRALRAIEARRRLELMTISTIEGFKSQLWTFVVKNGKKGDGQLLNQKLTQAKAARTGYFVWMGDLEVNQFGPKTADALFGNDTAWRLTLDVYRKLGITPRVISGESPDRNGRTSGDTTDVDVFMDRMTYGISDFTWEVNFLLKSLFGSKKAPVANMREIQYQVARRVKEILVPLMQFGVPPIREAFRMGGFDPDRAMEMHEQDWTWRQKYVHPYTGFSQAGPSGVTNSPLSPGRPAGKTETKPREGSTAKASVQDDYRGEIERLWFAMDESSGTTEDKSSRVKAFILALLLTNATYRRQAYAAGYASVGGQIGLSLDSMEAAVAWDSVNAQNFQEELLARVEAGQSISGLHNRALQYAQAGWRYAFMAGVFQAEAEHGMTHWVRVLNPTASMSGPCEQCTADAGRIHALAEPFMDHPNGVCTQRFVQFYNLGSGGSDRFPGGVVGLPYPFSFDAWHADRQVSTQEG